MSTVLWIIIGVAAVVALTYVLAMRNVLRESREKYKRIDRQKIRKWKDDEDEQ